MSMSLRMSTEIFNTINLVQEEAWRQYLQLRTEFPDYSLEILVAQRRQQIQLALYRLNYTEAQFEVECQRRINEFTNRSTE